MDYNGNNPSEKPVTEPDKTSGDVRQNEKKRRRRRRSRRKTPKNKSNVHAAPDASEVLAQANESSSKPRIDADETAWEKKKHGQGSSPFDERASTNRARPKKHVGLSRGKQKNRFKRPAYAALDLGTNNCRLLIAVPDGRTFKVIDAFSRIVRLGEGVGRSGCLSDDAMERAVEALKVCANKLKSRGIKRLRLIATEACRIAENGEEFLQRVKEEAGLELEIVNRETEARLAVAGCASLIDRNADGVILFDIGGGSSELVWLDLKKKEFAQTRLARRVRTWTSLPVGVVNISERHGGMHVTPDIFEDMVQEVIEMLDEFPEADALASVVKNGQVHMLGTSGTVTTLAGVHLGLEYYDRRKVDGLWMSDENVSDMTEKLLGMTFEERSANACIGEERADLVLAGCAILEALRRKWPCERLRVADRGLREGILYEMMNEDGVLQSPVRRRRRRRRNRRAKNSQSQETS